MGRMAIGACDQDCSCGWGLEPYSGALRRYTRGLDGLAHLLHLAPPPPGCPCGLGLRLMASNLRGKAEGSVIKISFDADLGQLSFEVDEQGVGRQLPREHIGYPRARVLSGFPRGTRLRPWAMLYLHLDDQVRLDGFAETPTSLDDRDSCQRKATPRSDVGGETAL